MVKNDNDQFTYDVALSFAGEDRKTVKRFAELLEAKSVKVFYDETEMSDLWGKNLIDHLADIYGKKARYCVMFISKHYPLKKWTNLERTHAQARAFRDANEYILPIRLDDTEVPGIAETIGYIDLRHKAIENVVDALERKLAKAKGQGPTVPAPFQDNQYSTPQSADSPFGSIPMPKPKKIFTQLEKDRYAKEVFNYMKKYFQHALQQLETHDSNVETEFDEITSLRFTGRIYLQGNIKAQCSIWLGDDILSNTIYYNEGTHRLNDKAINDYLPIADSGDELYVHIGDSLLSTIHVEEPFATQQQAAEYLWKRFTSPLERR